MTTVTERSEMDLLMFLGVEMRILLDAQRSDGKLTMFEARMPPGGDTGLHLHEREDESPIVLEGQLDVELDGVRRVVQAGQSCFLPRGVPHRLRNTGNAPVRAITVTTPGGFETLLRSVGSPPGASQPSLPEQIASLMRVAGDHGIQLLGAPS